MGEGVCDNIHPLLKCPSPLFLTVWFAHPSFPRAVKIAWTEIDSDPIIDHDCFIVISIGWDSLVAAEIFIVVVDGVINWMTHIEPFKLFIWKNALHQTIDRRTHPVNANITILDVEETTAL